MKEKWIIWIKASIAEHLRNLLDINAQFYVEGADEPPENVYPRFEIRVDGPNIEERSGVTRLLVFVNVLIITERDGKAYSHETLVGKAIAALDKNISVYKFGTNDDQSLYGCLQGYNEIITTNFGEIDDSGIIVQTTVERDYALTI